MSVTPAQFAEKVLTDLHLPATANNISALIAWMAFEGGHPFNPKSPFHYNPLNTTQKMPGSTSPGGVAGVQSYPDWKTGLDATVKTLGYGFYTAIRAALANSADPAVTLQAVKSSPWGTTAIPVNQWPALVAQIKGVTASGSLGFPWGWVIAPVAGAGAGVALGFGLPIGAALGATGYGAYKLIRRYV